MIELGVAGNHSDIQGDYIVSLIQRNYGLSSAIGYIIIIIIIGIPRKPEDVYGHGLEILI